MLDTHDVKEKRFNLLTVSVYDQLVSWQYSMMEQGGSIHGSWEAEQGKHSRAEEPGSRNGPQRLCLYESP